MSSSKSLLAVCVLTWAGTGPAMTTGAPAPSVQIRGIVFEDRNGNAMHDRNEPGISGVRVSDQVTVTSTGPDGRFLLQGDGGFGLVSISQPSHYEISGPFWRRAPADGQTLQFPLIKTEETGDFTFVHASDPHLSEENLDRFRRLREIVGEQQPAFVLLTGDLIRDALRVGEDEASGLYKLFVSELSEFPVPVWTSLGNHEIFGIERHLSLVSPEHPLYGKKMYRHYLGPNYYSFDFGGVRFLGLDTVAYDDLWYNGYVDAVQLSWLREELASVEPGTPVVTFSHIPLITSGEMLWGYEEGGAAPSLITVDGDTRYRHAVGNATEVLTELRQHELTLALAGHFHLREKLSFESDGVNTRFYTTSSVRSDLPDAAGMRMISGVVLYGVQDGQIDDGSFIPLDAER